MQVNVFGPGAEPARRMTIVGTPEGVALRPPKEEFQAETLCLSPPWIDSHCHIFDGTTSLGLKPDDIGLKTGVHLLVDAGSAGADTLRGFSEYVVPNAKTRILAFLNISAIGLVTLREYHDERLMDPRRTAEAIAAHPGLLRGVKARSSASIVEEKGTLPFQRAIEAAELAGCPVMVHMGETPPENDDNLRLFRAGDILTHCFHGKRKRLWTPDGAPIPEMEKAIARGVRLDVGHGAASFSAATAKPVLRRGFFDFSISTDLHARNVLGPVYSLAETMSKFLALGMPLGAVIRSVTDIPAKRLNLREWCADPAKNGTVFRVRAARPDDTPLTDAMNETIPADQRIEPVAVIVGGRWEPIDPAVRAPIA